MCPVLLFVYNRIDCLMATVNALKNNIGVENFDLFIFSDAPKSDSDVERVMKVRKYIKTINEFRNVVITEREDNYGLSKSIIEGVTEIINQYGKIIVLEDDLITSPGFLSFMNGALNYYENNDKIFSIAGYSSPVKNPRHDIYFTQRASSWGWATWKDRWNNIKWDLADDYKRFKNDKSAKKAFNGMGSDMCKMLDDQMKGKINSWAIRWCYNQFLTRQYTVFPTVSKVMNIGANSSATHTKDRFNRFETDMDVSGKTDFEWTDNILLNDHYLKQFLKPYTIPQRIKYKLLNTLLYLIRYQT